VHAHAIGLHFPHAKKAATMKAIALCVLGILTLSACVRERLQTRADQISMQVADRIKQPLQWPHPDVEKASAEILQQPLSAERVSQLALVRSAQTRILYADLGLSWAELLQSSQLANPTLDLSRLSVRGSPERERHSSITQSIADLLMLGARRKLAKGEFKRSAAEIQAELTRVSSQAQAQFFAYVGALQVLEVHTLAADLAQTEATLAARYQEAGNISKAQLAQVKAEAAESELRRLDAQTQLDLQQARLNELLAYPASQVLRVDAMLPAMLAREDDVTTLLEKARAQRADWVAADLYFANSEALKRHTQRWRWLGELSVSGVREREADGAKLLGLGLSLGLPLWHQNQSSLAQAQALTLQAQVHRDRLALQIQSEVESAALQLSRARERIVQLQQHLLPAYQDVTDAELQRYNFMLVGSDSLFAAKQKQYRSYASYLQALARYWQQRAALSAAIGGVLPSQASVSAASVSTNTLLQARVHKAQHGPSDHEGHKEHMDHSDHMDHKDHLDHVDHVDQQAHDAHMEHADHEAQKEHKEHEDHSDHKGHDKP
jgi:outer membrane protein, heavy metal efflux system